MMTSNKSVENQTRRLRDEDVRSALSGDLRSLLQDHELDHVSGGRPPPYKPVHPWGGG